MEESIPSKPATVVTVADLNRRLQIAQHGEGDDSWSYRANGFLFEDAQDRSGFGFLLSSSKRPSSTSEYVKINTRKVVPWPEDVREGDLVQVVSVILRPTTGEARIDALSVVRIDDLDTEFDLKLLHASYDDVIRFMERARPEVRSLVDSYLVSPSKSNNFHCPKEQNNRDAVQAMTNLPTSSVVEESLFDEVDDMDDANLIARLDRLSSTSDGENSSNIDTLTVSREKSRDLGMKTTDENQFVPPPPPRLIRTASGHSFASKNAGKFSRKVKRKDPVE